MLRVRFLGCEKWDISNVMMIVEGQKGGKAYRASCCSSSWIFAWLAAFFGFGFGGEGGGGPSFCAHIQYGCYVYSFCSKTYPAEPV